MGSNSGNITFISKRKEYDCNYFYLLISRIIPLNCRRGGSGRRLVKYSLFKQEKISHQITFLQLKMQNTNILVLAAMGFVGMLLLQIEVETILL